MPALLITQLTTPLLLSVPVSHARSLAGSVADSTRAAVLSRLPLEVSVTPNSKLPGTTQLNSLIGGMVTWVLLACVGAVLLGAAAWGIGNRSGYYGAQQNGRMMVLGGAVGAMVAGAASALVNFGFGLGSAVH
jgi:hypothetical protein